MDYVRQREAGRAAARYVIEKWPAMFPNAKQGQVKGRQKAVAYVYIVQIPVSVQGEELREGEGVASEETLRRECKLEMISLRTSLSTSPQT